MNTPRTVTLPLVMLCACVARGQTPAASPESESPEPVAIVAPASVEDPAPAPRAQTLADELISKIHAAGKIGYLQVMLSIIAVGIALECAARLRTKRICPAGLADTALEAMKQARYDDVLSLCQAQPSVLADILTAVVAHRDFAFAEIQLVAGDVSARRLKPHAQRAYPLAVIASISTLLGLLGTVIGMIASFEAVALAGSMGDPSIMASQISYALVTTAIGLSVAVPCIVAYQLLRRKAADLATELDEQVSTLISTWQIALRHQAEAPSAPGA